MFSRHWLVISSCREVPVICERTLRTLFTLIQLGRIHVYIYMYSYCWVLKAIHIYVQSFSLCNHSSRYFMVHKYKLYTFIYIYIYISYMSKLTNLYMEDALRPLWLHWMHHVHVKMILGVMFFFLTAFLLCYLLEVAASTFTLVGSSSQKTNGRFVFHTRGMLEVQRGETFQI